MSGATYIIRDARTLKAKRTVWVPEGEPVIHRADEEAILAPEGRHIDWSEEAINARHPNGMLNASAGVPLTEFWTQWPAGAPVPTFTPADARTEVAAQFGSGQTSRQWIEGVGWGPDPEALAEYDRFVSAARGDPTAEDAARPTFRVVSPQQRQAEALERIAAAEERRNELLADEADQRKRAWAEEVKYRKDMFAFAVATSPKGKK